MHSVEVVEEALALARQLGFAVRQEWLGGTGGGVCEIKGRKWIFVDLTLGPLEQAEPVAEALRDDPRILTLPLAPELRRFLKLRKSA